MGGAGEALPDDYDRSYSRLNAPLGKGMVVAAITLHDIGKLRELKYHPVEARYTKEGCLVGHVLMGRDLVRDASRERGDIDTEWLALLEHLILTVGERGHGKGPIVPEGLILQHADELDLGVSLFARCLGRDAGEGP